MDIAKEKFGISEEDLKNAALGDFDDYVPVKTEKKQKTPAPVSSVSSEKETGINIKPVKEKKQKAPEAEDKELTGFLSNLYIISFAKSLFTKNKIGVLIWMFLNIVVLSAPFIFVGISTGDFMTALPGIAFSVIGYSISLVIALSPVGEAILRWQNKCKKIKNAEILSRIQPLFDVVYAQAKAKDPTISDKVSLFISFDDSPNAFATGRRTVCITEGLLALSDEDIKGVLAHEFGHLSHKDTDIILAVAVGNMIITAITSIFNLFVKTAIFFVGIFTSDEGSSTYRILYNVFNFFYVALMYIWTKIGTLLCMYSNRKGEYAADAFAVDLGYGQELSSALATIDNGGFPASKGLWASLLSTHPATGDRINEMNLYSAGKNA